MFSAELAEKSSALLQNQEPTDAALARIRRESDSGGPNDGSHFLRAFLALGVVVPWTIGARRFEENVGEESGDVSRETLGRSTVNQVEISSVGRGLLAVFSDRFSLTGFIFRALDSTR